jgi:hypothetical protein
MKSLLIKTLSLTGALALYSHAIMGLGVQWAPSPGLEVKGSKGQITDTIAGKSASIELGKVTGLQGFGLKLWIDALPFVDIEATTNVQFGQYDVNLILPDNSKLALKYDLKMPLAPSKPMFARVVNDVSILYPFLKLPPVVTIAKIYVGAGLTYGLSTPLLDSTFARKALKNANLKSDANSADLSKALTEAIVKEGLKQGIGFHLIAGVRVKPPVIPLAVYANVKYHFIGAATPSLADGNSMTYELGGGLAF